MYFKSWSRQDRHRFYGRAQPCRNQSDVFDSPKLYCAKPTTETKIHRSIKFPPGILISAATTPQNLRIGLKKRWNGKSIGLVKLKGKQKTTFFSPTEKWCLPSPSKIKPEEREFVVDSCVSMHMISRKGLNSAALETVTTSRCPTAVITANGEVQTHEEATVYVRELEIFLTFKNPRRYASSVVAWKALRGSLILI